MLLLFGPPYQPPVCDLEAPWNASGPHRCCVPLATPSLICIGF